MPICYSVYIYYTCALLLSLIFNFLNAVPFLHYQYYLLNFTLSAVTVTVTVVTVWLSVLHARRTACYLRHSAAQRTNTQRVTVTVCYYRCIYIAIGACVAHSR